MLWRPRRLGFRRCSRVSVFPFGRWETADRSLKSGIAFCNGKKKKEKNVSRYTRNNHRWIWMIFFLFWRKGREGRRLDWNWRGERRKIRGGCLSEEDVYVRLKRIWRLFKLLSINFSRWTINIQLVAPFHEGKGKRKGRRDGWVFEEW